MYYVIMLQIKYLHKKFATIIMSWPNVKHTLIDFQECLYMKHTACDCESNCSSSLFDFSIILIRNNTWIFMTYQYGVPINDFLLHMVWVIWAETPKSAANINIELMIIHASGNLEYQNSHQILSGWIKCIEKDHKPNLMSPSSVNKILAPYWKKNIRKTQ